MNEAWVEMMFGGHCRFERRSASRRLLEAPVEAHSFERLLAHWAGMPESSRPRLRGLSLSPPGAADRLLRLILETAPGQPLVVLRVDWVRGRPVPGVAGVWPYAAWWEEELSEFEAVEFSGADTEARVEWRRS